jgi:hypothetical protein
MKLRYFIVVLLVIIVASCKNSEKNSVAGKWKIVEFRMTLDGKENVSTTKNLTDAGAVWDLNFAEDGKFRQDFNMSNPDMKMKMEAGTWKSTDDSLFINISVEQAGIDLKYAYSISNDTLVLNLEHSPSKNKIVSKFIRK